MSNKYKKYLPSKKFSLIILSIIIALGIVFGFSFFGRPKTVAVKLTDDQARAKIQEFMVLDSDHDGLPDWEEALWKTDPKKADTDSDGTSDGDEINANRDPLKPNTAPKGQEPNDKIDQKIIADNKKVEDDFAALSSTDKIGRTLFSQYLAVKKVNGSLSNDDIAVIVGNTLAELPQVTLKQYSLTDLTVFPSGTTASVKKYGNDVSEVLMKDLFAKQLAVQSYDFYAQAQINDIVNQLQSEDNSGVATSTLTELQSVIDEYDILVKALLKVPVPTVVMNEHLALVNSIESIHSNLSQIKASVNDIVLFTSLLSVYSDNISNFWPIIDNLGTALKNNQVTFTSGDYGNQLFNGILN